MFKRLLLVGASALTVISCSSNQVKLTENEIAQYRAPASTLDEMEQKFQGLMQNVSNSAKVRADLLQRLLQVNYRIEGEVNGYEAELDAAIQRRKGDPTYSFAPQASPTYSRLMQLRYFADKEVTTVAHVYKRLIDTSGDVQLPGALREKANRALNVFHQSLKSLTSADRIQTLELFESLREVARRQKGASVEAAGDRLPASVSQSWASVEKAFAPFESDDISDLSSKHRSETAKKAQKAMSSNDVQLEPMQDPIPQSDRSPSSEKYAPGTGTYGNIIGLSFPVGLFSLTYDDGPNTTSTVELMDVLSSTGTPATMFWLTQMIARNPTSVEKAKSLGFPINSHSWSHQNLVKLGPAGMDKEINQAVTVAQDKVGTQPFNGKKTFRFFRCPYGACFSPANAAVRSRMANMNLIHAFWTVDSLDWKYAKVPDRVYELTVKGMQASGRGVVLMHDIHNSTVGVTRRVIAWAKKENQAGQKIRFATLENAVDEYNKGVRQ